MTFPQYAEMRNVRGTKYREDTCKARRVYALEH